MASRPAAVVQHHQFEILRLQGEQRGFPSQQLARHGAGHRVKRMQRRLFLANADALIGRDAERVAVGLVRAAAGHFDHLEVVEPLVAFARHPVGQFLDAKRGAYAFRIGLMPTADDAGIEVHGSQPRNQQRVDHEQPEQPGDDEDWHPASLGHHPRQQLAEHGHAADSIGEQLAIVLVAVGLR